LAGCGGPSLTPNQHATAFRSVAGASARDLLYVVIEEYPAAVDAYSYPQDQLEGQLTGFSLPVGDCADKKGNVYIADYAANTVIEYSHGGSKPIRTLAVPGSGSVSCAVDPAGGDLAVTVAGGTSGIGAALAIYRPGKAKPKTYTYKPILRYAYCTYDDAGNLFVDGEPAQGYGDNFELAELPRDQTSLQAVTLQGGLPWSAALQWDGKYLTVGQNVRPQILRYTIAGGDGTYVGSTPLTDSYDAMQFVIAGNKAIVVNRYYVDRYVTKWNVLVYRYPQGGYSIEDMVESSTPVGSVALSRLRK